MSANQAAKAAGYDSFYKFLQCYGLSIYKDDDVAEGKSILRGMGYDVE